MFAVAARKTANIDMVCIVFMALVFKVLVFALINAKAVPSNLACG
jgi:hypothetical protein